MSKKLLLAVAVAVASLLAWVIQLTSQRVYLWPINNETLTYCEKVYSQYEHQISPGDSDYIIQNSVEVPGRFVNDCKQAMNSQCPLKSRYGYYDTYRISLYMDGTRSAVILFSGTGK